MHAVYILYTTYNEKKSFRQSFFLYSPCPYLEGIKDALCNKFRRPTIGQNCSALCTKAIEKHSRTNGAKQCTFWEACSAVHMLPSLERQDLFFGGRFDVWAEQEHRYCSGEFKQLLLTWYGLQSSRFKVHAAACALYCTNSWYTARKKSVVALVGGGAQGARAPPSALGLVISSSRSP